jgi:hypothetical protein
MNIDHLVLDYNNIIKKKMSFFHLVNFYIMFFFKNQCNSLKLKRRFKAHRLNTILKVMILKIACLLCNIRTRL